MTNTLKAIACSLALACAMATASVAQSATPPPQDPATPAQPSAPPQQPQEQATAPGATNSAGQPTRIAPGSVIPVELTKTVDAKKAKTGDEVVAKVTQDMKTGSGEVLVPKDTKLIGHVTEAQAHSKEQKQSELGITFDKAVTKSGEMKLPMSIQAIIAPPSSSPADSGSSAPPSEPSTAGTTGTSPMNGRNSASASSATQSQPPARPNDGTDEKQASSARPPINASTQGVIGIPNLTLATDAQNTSQGSVMTSEKNNVKLESGTMLLLRVSQ